MVKFLMRKQSQNASSTIERSGNCEPETKHFVWIILAALYVSIFLSALVRMISFYSMIANVLS